MGILLVSRLDVPRLFTAVDIGDVRVPGACENVVIYSCIPWP
jgi:hypothetical protein